MPVYVLESRPAPGTSSYARIVTSVDQDTCVPLLVRLHERADAPPRKVLTTDPDQMGDHRIRVDQQRCQYV